MSIRPGQAKGPYVGPISGSGTGDHKVMVESIDALAEYLSDKIVAAGGLVATTIDKGGGVEAVQISGSGVTGDHKVMVEGSDLIPEYLADKITGAGGIVATTYDKGMGVEAVQISGSSVVGTTTGDNVGVGTGTIFKSKVGNLIGLKTLIAGTGISITNGTNEITLNSTAVAGSQLKVTVNDTTAGYLQSKAYVEGGSNLVANPSGNEQLLFRELPGFHDDFTTSKPFWVGTQAITSADWSVDVANTRLNGIAQNNDADWIRHSVAGDFDYMMSMDTNGATSGGFDLQGESITVTWKLVPGSNRLSRSCTGESDVYVTYNTTAVQIRVKRVTNVLTFYHRVNTTDTWILDNTLTKIIGNDVKVSLDSMTNGRIYWITLHDNMFPQRIRSDCGKVIPLTDGSTITMDLRMGNLFTVTLGGNRTIGAPTYPQVRDGLMFILRVRQDASPPRTLSWNSIFRFPGGVSPTLTEVANKTDYFGFIWNMTDSKYDCIAQEFNL